VDENNTNNFVRIIIPSGFQGRHYFPRMMSNHRSGSLLVGLPFSSKRRLVPKIHAVLRILSLHAQSSGTGKRKQSVGYIVLPTGFNQSHPQILRHVKSKIPTPLVATS
jgi:hypothetical protein